MVQKTQFLYKNKTINLKVLIGPVQVSGLIKRLLCVNLLVNEDNEYRLYFVDTSSQFYLEMFLECDQIQRCCIRERIIGDY